MDRAFNRSFDRSNIEITSEQLQFVNVAPAKPLYFHPKEDITPLESAILAHFFTWAYSAQCRAEMYERWEEIKRHFSEEKEVSVLT